MHMNLGPTFQICRLYCFPSVRIEVEKLGIFIFTEFLNPHVDPEFGGENVCIALFLLSCSAGDRTEDLCVLGKCSTTEPHPQQKKKFIKRSIEGHSKAKCFYTQLSYRTL